jgi:hypothetical protein
VRLREVGLQDIASKVDPTINLGALGLEESLALLTREFAVDGGSTQL